MNETIFPIIGSKLALGTVQLIAESSLALGKLRAGLPAVGGGALATVHRRLDGLKKGTVSMDNNNCRRSFRFWLSLTIGWLAFVGAALLNSEDDLALKIACASVARVLP